MAWNDLDHITAEKLNNIKASNGIDAIFIAVDSQGNYAVIGSWEACFDKLVTNDSPLISLFCGRDSASSYSAFSISPAVWWDGSFLCFANPYNSAYYLKWAQDGTVTGVPY